MKTAFFDPFLAALICAVLLASFLPCPELWQPEMGWLTTILIIFMFFFQGAKLKRSALIDSAKNWKLQGTVLLATFVIFPILAVCTHVFFEHFLPNFLTDDLWKGVLFLACLPSTVQSSIALTSIAQGNVTAAICAATASNILGIFFTPILTGFLLGKSGGGGDMMHTIFEISYQLLLPFIFGQLVQKWVGPIVKKHKILLSFTDRGSIIVMVYAAFSSAVRHDLWKKIPPLDFATVAFICTALLITLLITTHFIGKALKQNKENMIALQFCGSKKSLATGVPMASVIFSGNAGIIVIPLMIYHQIQLFLCTLLAKRYQSEYNKDHQESDQGNGTPST